MTVYVFVSRYMVHMWPKFNSSRRESEIRHQRHVAKLWLIHQDWDIFLPIGQPSMKILCVITTPVLTSVSCHTSMGLTTVLNFINLNYSFGIEGDNMPSLYVTLFPF